MTPTLLKIRQQRKAFYARIAAMARPDPGISCLSVSERVPEPEVKPIDSAAVFARWVERQAALNPIPAPAPKKNKGGRKPTNPIEPPPDIKPIPMRLIQTIVAHDYGVTLVDIFSSRRMADTVRPRQVAMYLAKVLTVRSLPDIGRRFGGRDHTTVLYAVRKIDHLYKTDSELAARVDALKSKIMGQDDDRHIHDHEATTAPLAAAEDRVPSISGSAGVKALDPAC